MTDAELINDTDRASRRSSFTISLSNQTAEIQMRAIITEIRRMLTNFTLIEPNPTVRFKQVNTSSLDITVAFFVLTPDMDEYLALQEEVNFEILKIMKANNASFATPTSTVFYQFNYCSLQSQYIFGSMKKKIEFSTARLYTLFYKQILINLMLICMGNMAYASLGVSVANSNWTNASTWSFSGVNRLPNCSDSIRIGSSNTVTVNSQVDYTACSGPMIIYVYGILEFTNGNKLDLPCGSVVFIMSGGLIKKSTAGGGSSTLISICGVTEWKAGDGPLSGVDTLGSATTLPVELINFEADKVDGAVKLTWSTATEVNNEYFTIERSNDGKHFGELEKITGAGNSSFSNTYSMHDNDPLEGVSYYRLS
ncbi:MAG: mechanosensitive ion channel family protein [Bacteroidetes bacterium]|nr:mechanosensitive ion channel family protein [Bacteroidota bacterium]